MAKPNVIVVVFDAARMDRFGCYGYPRRTTPAIDAFSREALVFERARTPSPWTIPSHASLFTGLYPREHMADYPLAVLSDGAATIAEHLRVHGYSTFAISNNPLIGPESGLSRGLERLIGREKLNPQHTRSWRRRLGNLFGTLDSGARATNRTIRTMLPDATRPFLLFVNYMECHWKYLPPSRFERRFAKRFSRMGSLRRRAAFRGRFSWEMAQVLDADELAALSDLYDAELACLDESFGELLDILQRMRVLDDSILVVLADHGEMLGEHAMMGHGMALWRPLLHVPLLARFPDRRRGRVQGLVDLTDIFPGLCEESNLPTPRHLHHRNHQLNPFRLSHSERGKEHVFAEWHRWPDARLQARRRRAPHVNFDRWPTAEAVEDGRYKLIVSEDGAGSLYDVENDPGETKDLTPVLPTVRSELQGTLQEWKAGHAAIGRSTTLRPEDEQLITARLTELGYL